MFPNVVPPVYGLKPSAPKKPNQSLSEVKDAEISGHMLGLIKSQASLLAKSAPEITNGTVRRVAASQVQQFIEMAYELFMYQNQHAYYQVPQLNANDTAQMLQAYVPANGAPQMPINNKPPVLLFSESSDFYRLPLYTSSMNLHLIKLPVTDLIK
ncbi:spore coat protein [Paenibacillus pabuli]|uniref:spore coat protein n=1 Tax=Paenibacillus pabuli TaxID=1472 RepID=UPI003CEB4E4E